MTVRAAGGANGVGGANGANGVGGANGATRERAFAAGTRAIAAAGAVLASLAVTAPAEAEDHEHHLGVDVGGGLLVINDKSTKDLGATFMAHYTYGLSDAFMLMVEAQYSQVALGQTADSPKTPHTYPSWIGNADVGIGYVFDVLTWVPYAGLLIGGYDLSGGTIPGMKILPGAEVALGLDYRLTPSVAVGVAGRQHMVSKFKEYPSFTQLLARVEIVWGR
jgi:Outer membrane protein beta-barrel domain